MSGLSAAAMSQRKKSKSGGVHDPWVEVKRKCHLNAETLRMAKELGLAPRSVLKNVPSPSQRWKAPVHVWIRDMYARRRTGTGVGGDVAGPSRPRVPRLAPTPPEERLAERGNEELDWIEDQDSDSWSFLDEGEHCSGYGWFGLAAPRSRRVNELAP